MTKLGPPRVTTPETSAHSTHSTHLGPTLRASTLVNNARARRSCLQGPAQVAAPEISAYDPHHGAHPRGNPALQQALGRTQGDRVDKIMGKYAAPEEVLELPGSCYACGVEGTTKMFQTSIPFFKVSTSRQQHLASAAC